MKDTEQVTGQPGKLRDILESLEFMENNCLSYRHDFGLMSDEERSALRFEYREWIRAMYNNGLIDKILSLFTFTDDEIEEIISEVDDMHPYKKPGVRESYYEYAEGWADACDELGDRIKAAMNKQTEK